MIHLINETTYNHLISQGYNLNNGNCIILPDKTKPREIRYGLGTTRNIKSRLNVVEQEAKRIIDNYESRTKDKP